MIFDYSNINDNNSNNSNFYNKMSDNNDNKMSDNNDNDDICSYDMSYQKEVELWRTNNANTNNNTNTNTNTNINTNTLNIYCRVRPLLPSEVSSLGLLLVGKSSSSLCYEYNCISDFNTNTNTNTNSNINTIYIHTEGRMHGALISPASITTKVSSSSSSSSSPFSSS